MRYTFSDCRLDTATRDFTRNGVDIHLSPKAFELLRLLIEQRPRVMTKHELMDELWPGTFVVEANLHVLVGELRSAFGEKSARGGSIKTHHGIGYSFASEAREQRSRPRRSSKDRSKTALAVGDRRMALAAGPNQVGRDRDCEVFLDDASVSRHHALITVARRVVTVEDLDSKNGVAIQRSIDMRKDFGRIVVTLHIGVQDHRNAPDGVVPGKRGDVLHFTALADHHGR